MGDIIAYNRIKVVIVEKGRTNRWLAKQLKVDETTVSRWCTNDMQPTVERLFDIAKALDVDVRDLLISNNKRQ